MSEGVVSRILSGIDVQPGPALTGCWNWTRAVHENGYGMVWSGNTMSRAHRVIYEYMFGPIADGLVTDHLCRNRACVNPTHLEVVTQRVNLLRGRTLTAALAARSHCDRGHPFDAANTVMTLGRRGVRHRRCHLCKKQREKNGRARRRAARSQNAAQ